MRIYKLILIGILIFSLQNIYAEAVLIDDFQDIIFVNYYEKQFNDLYGDVGWGSDVEDVEADPDWEMYRPNYSISTIKAERVYNEYVGDDWQGGSMRIHYKQVYDYYYVGLDGIARELDGYVYFYESLVPESVTKRKTNWINGFEHEYLSFWIKVESGNPDFAVLFELATNKPNKPEKFLTTTNIPINYYLQTSESDNNGWKKIKIPMKEFIVNASPLVMNYFKKLKSLNFSFNYHTEKTNRNNSQGIFYIDNIMLSHKEDENEYISKKSGEVIREFMVYDPIIVEDIKKEGFLGENQPPVYDKVPIYISLQHDASIEIKIYNKNGLLIKHFESKDYLSTGEGEYEIIWWDIKKIPPGIYLVYVNAKSDSAEDRLKSSFLLIR